jgi:hypothetical protein
VTFHVLLLKRLRGRRKTAPTCPLLGTPSCPVGDAGGGFSSASRTGNHWSASAFSSMTRPGRLVLFEMSPSTELLAYAALALVAYAVALLLLWLWL